MSVRRVLWIGMWGGLATTALFAGTAPVAVSPGDASKLVLIADTCPTFSWSQVDGAEGYELVVYGVGEEDKEALPVLRQSFKGSVFGWTPSLNRCLEHGREYAWSVRALGSGEATSEWSPPSLFQVAAGPTAAQVEEAVAAVQSYLQERKARPEGARGGESVGPLIRARPMQAGVVADKAAAEAETRPPEPSAPGPGAALPPVAFSLATDGPLGVGTSTPLADLHVVGSPTLGSQVLAPGGGLEGSAELVLAENADGSLGMVLRYDGSSNSLQVWGRLSGNNIGPWLSIHRETGAAAFGGPLAGLRPDPPCFDNENRFVGCGNGTVTDTVTGLIWLADPKCSSSVSYQLANSWAGGLSEGQCDLTDGSRAGDWRLATKEEWEAIFKDDCTSYPKLIGADGGCYLYSPWASDSPQTHYWSSSTDSSDVGDAWHVDTYEPEVVSIGKVASFWAWPVRGGQ